jgi:hypothetical protein
LNDTESFWNLQPDFVCHWRLVLVENGEKKKGSGHRSVHSFSSSVVLSLNRLLLSLLHPGAQVFVGALSNQMVDLPADSAVGAFFLCHDGNTL